MKYLVTFSNWYSPRLSFHSFHRKDELWRRGGRPKKTLNYALVTIPSQLFVTEPITNARTGLLGKMLRLKAESLAFGLKK